jgi:hypothetical protein
MNKFIDYEKLLNVYNNVSGGCSGWVIDDFLSVLIEEVGKVGNEGGKLEYNDIMNVLLYVYNNGE